jgi:predicted RNA-binding protein YlxR (DUF448 family)
MQEKDRLFRLFRLKGESRVQIDIRRSGEGKGLYLCRTGECLEVFLKDKRFRKRFHESIAEESMQLLRRFAEEGSRARMSPVPGGPSPESSEFHRAATLPGSEGSEGFE